MLESDRQGHFQVEAGSKDDLSISWSIPVHRWWFCANHPPRWPEFVRNRATTPHGGHRQRKDQSRASHDRPYRDRRHYGLRCAGHGAARRGTGKKPARRLIPVAAQALRIRQRPPAARAVAETPHYDFDMDGALSAFSGVRVLDSRRLLSEDLMFPTPKSALTPNTYAYESYAAGQADRLPRIRRALAARERDQPDGRAGPRHGSRHAYSRARRASPKSSPATISAAIRRRSRWR